MPFTSSQSMGMIGGASLRMSPSRSARHRSSLAADFMKQMRMRSEAQRRYQRNQVTLTQTMRTRMRQDENRRRRQTAAFQEKISRVRGRIYADNKTNRRTNKIARPSSASSRIRVPKSPYEVSTRGQKTRANINARTGLNSRKIYVPVNNTTSRQQRRRPASAGEHRSQRQPQWQLVGSRVGQRAIFSSKIMRLQEQDEREARRRQRPKSADPRGRRRIQQPQSFGSHTAKHVNAPTIVPARMSPRSRSIANKSKKMKRPQSARPSRRRRDGDMSMAAGAAASTTRKMIQHEVGRPTRSICEQVASPKQKTPTFVIPTAGMDIHDNDADNGTKFYDMDFFEKDKSQNDKASVVDGSKKSGSKTDSGRNEEKYSSPREQRSDVHKITLSPKPPARKARSPQRKQRISIVSSPERQLQNTKEVAAKMQSGFSQFEFSVLTSTMGKVASSRSWHVNALQLLEFGKKDMGLNISLSQCQALLANCPMESWLKVFDHTAWITINGKGDARSARISDHEVVTNGAGFFLDYNSFRERFWEPINKKLRSQLSRLKKADFVITPAEAGTSDPEAAWEPKSLVSGHEGGKRSRRDQVDLCDEQLKQCRRLRSLYISIRRGLKRRHKSCSVAFSSFKLATDPVVSCETLKKAARLCAHQVLSSCQLHIAEHEFIGSIAWLGQEWAKACRYSGVLKQELHGATRFIESRAFFQWLCLGRYSDSIRVPIHGYDN